MTPSRIDQFLDALATLLNAAVDQLVASLAACAWLISPEAGASRDEQDPQS
jgi:hypothetical protein